MTYGKEILPTRLKYRSNRFEIPLRLRLFLFFLTIVAIGFGVFLASLIH